VRLCGRLFKGLEQRILCRFAHAICALNERDAAPTLYGKQSEARLELANWRDADLISGAARRNACEIRVGLSRHQPACAALPAGAAALRAYAEECCRNVTCERSRPRATWRHDQQGVWWNTS
jgi:hypothetical protein